MHQYTIVCFKTRIKMGISIQLLYTIPLGSSYISSIRTSFSHEASVSQYVTLYCAPHYSALQCVTGAQYSHPCLLPATAWCPAWAGWRREARTGSGLESQVQPQPGPWAGLSRALSLAGLTSAGQDCAASHSHCENKKKLRIEVIT